jgi:4-hydroxy-2-oxoheptanedioate aldolase
MIGPHRLRERLMAGRPVLGPIINFDSPWLVDICGTAGFDFVLIDCEHGPMTPCGVENMVRAAEAAGLSSVVRVPANLPHEILRYLDIGAVGVKVPKIESEAEALQVRDSVRYPPLGQRGLAAITRAAGYGLTVSAQQYVEIANRELLAFAMVESSKGVEEIDRIAAVRGIDVISIGPGDLSVSMGFGGDRSAAPVREAIAHVIARTKALGKWVSLPAADAAGAQACVEQGANLVFINVSPFFYGVAKHLVDHVQSRQS